MEDFVIANFVLALQDAYSRRRTGRQKILTDLYYLVSKPANIPNGDGDGEYLDCAKTSASEIVNRMTEVHGLIRQHSGDAAVRRDIVESMGSTIVVNIHPDKEQQLIDRLSNMINNSNLVEEQKRSLLDLANPETIAEFLSETFLLVLVQTNTKELNPVSNSSEDESKMVVSTHKDLIEIPVPETISNVEDRYVQALYETYAEAQGGIYPDCSALDNDESHKTHFDKQRRLFYAAEALRRGVRDVYADDGISHFEKLEKDVYEGIDEVYEKPYKLGLDRLTEVLIQAAKLPLHGNFLARETYWVDSGVQKGICHFLVNDEKIDGWVR